MHAARRPMQISKTLFAKGHIFIPCPKNGYQKGGYAAAVFAAFFAAAA